MKAKSKTIKLENVRLQSPVLSYPADAAAAVHLVVTIPLLCDFSKEAAEQLGLPADQFTNDSRVKSATVEAPPESMGLTFDPINVGKESMSFTVTEASVHQATATPGAIKFSVAVKAAAEAACDWCKDYRGESFNLTMVANQTELDFDPAEESGQGVLPGADPDPPKRKRGRPKKDTQSLPSEE